MAYRRIQKEQTAKTVLIIFGICAFIVLLSVGIAKSNIPITVIACITVVITVVAATAKTRYVQSRPRDHKGRISGNHTNHHGDWHPTYDTRQYMLKRDRREARLRRQGRDVEADADEKETNKRTWKKDSRNI